MTNSIKTLAVGTASVTGIEVVSDIPTDPSFYTDLFKILLQLVIAIITLFKFFKDNKNKNGN